MLKKIFDRHQKKAQIVAARLNEQLNLEESKNLKIIAKKIKGAKEWELVLG